MPRRRRLALLVALTAAIGVPATAAWTYWSGLNDVLRGPGLAGAATIGRGAVPTAARAGGTSATVRWGASTLSNGRSVDGYRIRRYQADTGVEGTIGSGCSGVVVAQICTEAGLPTGASWRYTVTPVLANHWSGGESIRSGAVAVQPAAVILAKRLFGPPLPAQTTGSVIGFAPGEHISYHFGPHGGTTTIAGLPEVVDADGNATITALTIPDAPDGSHTIHVVGADSGIDVDAGIVTDTTPPVITAFVTPSPNAAGWNRTPVELNGEIDDGAGSGLAFIKGTADGSDPRTSPTAAYYAGVPVPVVQTTTFRYYGVDYAGNATAVLTFPVKIDMVPPVFGGEIVDVTGGALANAGSAATPGLAFYRGAAAGSFRVKVTVAEDGGSAPASVGTSELVEVATGFTHAPAVITTPAGGPYLTPLYSWLAGTTSTPTGTITVTDVAGNTTVYAGSMNNDSTAPTGSAVDATGLTGTGNRYSTSTSLNLVLTRGTDVGSGLAATGARLLRASAPLTASGGVVNGACGTYSAYAQVGADDPAAATVDTVPTDSRCYRYSYAVPDKVGNVATSTSGDIKVEAAPPASLTPSIAQIVPVTGVAAQYVSGTTLYYKPLQTGSFTVSTTASDAWSGITNVGFPVLGGFSGGGVVTTPVSGTTFKTTYSWSNNPASASPGTLTLTATDNAGHSRSTAFSIVKDDTGPDQALSITGAIGAYLDGTKLWYRPTASGTFKIVDATTDQGSGAASATFPNLGLSGWTHAMQIVTTPSGGPFTSSSFSWTPFPSSPGSYVVTAVDRLGTAPTTTLTFNQDQSPPSGTGISYPSGIVTTLTVPLTLTLGSDGGSGVNDASGIVMRDQTMLNTGTNTCGSFPNTFATTVTPVGGADTSVSNNRCYKYRYLVSDNVGNQTPYTSNTVVKIKTG